MTAWDDSDINYFSLAFTVVPKMPLRLVDETENYL